MSISVTRHSLFMMFIVVVTILVFILSLVIVVGVEAEGESICLEEAVALRGEVVF